MVKSSGMKTPGAAVGLKPLPADPNQKMAHFDFILRNLLVVGPNEAVLSKMKHIAFKLAAKVRGEEGEIYEDEVACSPQSTNYNGAEKTSVTWKVGGLFAGFLR